VLGSDAVLGSGAVLGSDAVMGSVRSEAVSDVTQHGAWRGRRSSSSHWHRRGHRSPNTASAPNRATRLAWATRTLVHSR